MILGWRRGTHLGRYVMLDPIFPWPSLHHGREAMRAWATRNNRQRLARGDEGPWRTSWPVKTSVKEHGDAVIAVLPVDGRAGPRQWQAADAMWRQVLSELARFVAQDLMCQVRLEWMPGGEPFQKSITVSSLQGIKGFYGWRRGEREPNASVLQRQIRDGILRGMKSGQSAGRGFSL